MFITHMATCRNSGRLQYRWLSFVHASCAKIVVWLTRLTVALQRVSKGSSWELMKLILLYLTFPIFDFSQLVFKLGYTVGERRLLLLTGERNSGGVHKLCVNLGDCGNKLVVIRKLIGRLRKT